jgi:hypothetical protein
VIGVRTVTQDWVTGPEGLEKEINGGTNSNRAHDLRVDCLNSSDRRGLASKQREGTDLNGEKKECKIEKHG